MWSACASPLPLATRPHSRHVHASAVSTACRQALWLLLTYPRSAAVGLAESSCFGCPAFTCSAHGGLSVLILSGIVVLPDLSMKACMSGLHTSSRSRSFVVDGLRVCGKPCQQCCDPTHLQAPRMVEHLVAVLTNAGLVLRLDLWWCWFQKYHRPQAPACSGRQETQEGPLCSRACLVRHERAKCKRQEGDHAKDFESF